MPKQTHTHSRHKKVWPVQAIADPLAHRQRLGTAPMDLEAWNWRVQMCMPLELGKLESEADWLRNKSVESPSAAVSQDSVLGDA